MNGNVDILLLRQMYGTRKENLHLGDERVNRATFHVAAALLQDVMEVVILVVSSVAIEGK